jgi:sec-independent protein translocase protein TatC
MARYNSYQDPEDMFADTRMSFGDHIEDLRTHLLRAIYGFLLAMLVSFFFGKPVLDVFIIHPVEVQLQKFYDDRRREHEQKILAELKNGKVFTQNKPRFEMHETLSEEWRKKLTLEDLRDEEKLTELPKEAWVPFLVRIPSPVEDAAAMLEVHNLLAPQYHVKAFSITESLMVWFKICLLVGLVLGSPWIFWQVWMFVAAGLYPHEKKYVHIYLPFSLGLFLLGVLFCQFIVMPQAIAGLLWFNKWLNIEPDLRLSEWILFAIALPVVCGLSFQTPLIMLFLQRLGLFGPETFRAKRRIAYFILATATAVMAPPDAQSMLVVWGALCLLYELGIWLCVWMPGASASDSEETSETEEMVEV